MKYFFLSAMILQFLATAAYAGSIYKCTGDDGKVTFTDKPCDDMKSEVVHKETEEEEAVRILRGQRAKISRLIRLGKDQAARQYASENHLEDIYEQEVQAYDSHLEQQIKQQELASKKQEQQARQQELLMQQQSLLLKQQELLQQQQQLEAQKGNQNRSSYYYPYPYNWPSTLSTCKQYGTVKKCNPSRYGTHSQSTATPEWQQKRLPEWQQQRLLRGQSIGTDVNIKGKVTIQKKNSDTKTDVKVYGSF